MISFSFLFFSSFSSLSFHHPSSRPSSLLYFSSIRPSSLPPLVLSSHSTLPPSTGVHNPHTLDHHSFKRAPVGKWPAPSLETPIPPQRSSFLQSNHTVRPLLLQQQNLLHKRVRILSSALPSFYSLHTSCTLTTTSSTRGTKYNSTFMFTSLTQKTTIQQQQRCRSIKATTRTVRCIRCPTTLVYFCEHFSNNESFIP